MLCRFQYWILQNNGARLITLLRRPFCPRTPKNAIPGPIRAIRTGIYQTWADITTAPKINLVIRGINAEPKSSDVWRWVLNMVLAKKRNSCAIVGRMGIKSLKWHVIQSLMRWSTCPVLQQELLCDDKFNRHQTREINVILTWPQTIPHKWIVAWPFGTILLPTNCCLEFMVFDRVVLLKNFPTACVYLNKIILRSFLLHFVHSFKAATCRLWCIKNK
jgi:hypothetical protein